eukprot:6002878-Alexandrium_andersonii.AAC.1
MARALDGNLSGAGLEEGTPPAREGAEASASIPHVAPGDACGGHWAAGASPATPLSSSGGPLSTRGTRDWRARAR